MSPPGSPRRTHLQIEQMGDVTVISFLDKRILDEQNIQAIADQMFGLVDDQGRHQMLLDFSKVEYMSSAALGKLITLHKKIRDVKGKLILCGIGPQILEVFTITKFDKIFIIKKDRDEGLNAF
jgi:anti-sigma B factor antagonist